MNFFCSCPSVARAPDVVWGYDKVLLAVVDACGSELWDYTSEFHAAYQIPTLHGAVG